MIKLNRPRCPNPEALRTNYKHRENKGALIRGNFDKCMYCESKISHIYYGDIEHIKPKDAFPELEFTWENLGYACARCNGYKSNKYDEHDPILNPYSEVPDGHIVALGALIAYRGDSIKGKVTIQKSTGVHLNRPSLIEMRQEKIKNIEKVIEICEHLEDGDYKTSALEELKKEAKEDKEYSFCIKALLSIKGLN